MTSDSSALPVFKYFPDPVGNGCIEKKDAVCLCCGKARDYMYTGLIYCPTDEEEVCPWCIADGSAAVNWSASFNDIYNIPETVPEEIAIEIETRTPGFSTWQQNYWLYSENDAMIFVGEVEGKKLVEEGNQEKIDACMKALEVMTYDWKLEDLEAIVPAGDPAIYLFYDPQSGRYEAYSDMS